MFICLCEFFVSNERTEQSQFSTHFFARFAFGAVRESLGEKSRVYVLGPYLVFDPSTNTIGYDQNLIGRRRGVFSTTVFLVIVWNDDRLVSKIGPATGPFLRLLPGHCQR